MLAGKDVQDLSKCGGTGRGRAVAEEDVVKAEQGTQRQGWIPGAHGPCQESPFSPRAHN